MLDVLRRNAGSWAIKIILTFIALTFVIWGVGTYSERGADWAARVGGKEITAGQVAEAASGLEKTYREVYGNAFTPEMARALNLKRQALDTLIRRTILLSEARTLGLVASDVEIQREIAATPAFQANGQFSESQYRSVLGSNRISTTEYEAARRDEITLRKMEGILAASARVSEAEARDFYEATARKVRLLVVTADPGTFRDLPPPSDADISARYEQTRESYRIPARVKLLAARFDPDAFARSAEATEEEIKSFYEGNPDRFRTEESRLVSVVLFPFSAGDKEAARRKAEGLLAEAAKGKAAFDAAAKRIAGSRAEAWMTRKELRPELVDAVFSAAVDQAVGPVETAGGLLVARVNRIRFPESLPLAQVRDRAAALLKREKGKDAAVIKAYEAHGKTLESKDLRAACAPYGIAPVETGWLGGRGGNGEGIPPAVVQEALLLPVKEIGPVKTVGDVHYLYQVLAKEESRVPPLADVRDAVKAAAVREKKKAAAKSAIENALSGAKTAAELERGARSAGLAASTTPYFSPVSGALPPALLAAGEIRKELLSLSAKTPVSPKVFPAGEKLLALAYVDEQRADAAEWAARKEAIIAGIAESKKEQVIEAFLAERIKQVKVEINPDVLK